jgi:hypothetical protein
VIEPSTTTLKPRQFRYNLPAILCGFLIGVYALFFVYRAGTVLFYPYPLEYGEGVVFYETGQLNRDGFSPASLYPANNQPPYRISNYTPLQYYLAAFMMLITGTRSILVVRLVSVLACVGLALVLYWLTRREEMAEGVYGSRKLAWAAALTPFALQAFYLWGMLAKPDSLGLAFSMAGAAVAWQTRRQPQRTSLYIIAGVACALGLLGKQSFIAAPIAIVIWLAGRRQWRGASIFLATLVGLGGGSALFFQLASGGNFFKHVIAYNSGQELNFDILAGGLNYFLMLHFIMLGLVGWRAVEQVRKPGARLDFWLLYFVIAFAVSFSVAKVGAAINYYMESLAILALLAWWQVGRVLVRSTARKPLGTILKVSLAGLTLFFMVLQLLIFRHIPTDDGNFTPSSEMWQVAEQFNKAVPTLAQRGPIFAEDSGWLALHGLATDLDDPFAFGQLQHKGEWDNNLLLNRLKSGYYRTVFFEIDQIPDNVAEVDQMVRDCKARPLESRYEPAVFQLLTDCSKFKPVQRIGRWLVLEWNG